MPRPEGYASMQFDQVESAGKQVIVECRHCKNKRLARSVASRKVKHLQQCPEFRRHVAGLIASNDEELHDVPEELLHGPSRRTQLAGAGGGNGYAEHNAQQTPVRRQFDVSLPTLLDGLGSGGRETLSTPLDDIRDWNHASENDTPMGEASTSEQIAPSTVPPLPRPRHQSQTTHPESVPERAAAFAHRAAQRRKEKLDNVLTRAIFEGSLPFNVTDAVKHPAMAEFFRLVDYVPPNKLRIADDVYDHTHGQSDEIIAYTS